MCDAETAAAETAAAETAETAADEVHYNTPPSVFSKRAGDNNICIQ
jgi:hypothetical protein